MTEPPQKKRKTEEAEGDGIGPDSGRVADNQISASAEDTALNEKFWKWLQDRGFEPNVNTKIQHFSDRCRGVVATAELDKGDSLFKVPKEMRLSVSNACLKDVLTPKARKKMGEWTPLILSLLAESVLPGSAWRPYLDVLPEDPGNPHLWSEEERQELKGTSIEDRIGLDTIEEEYKRIGLPFMKSNPSQFPLGDLATRFSLRQFVRMGCIVMAYSFTHEDGEVCMMPFADTLNHRTGWNNARLYGQAQDSFHVMRAERVVKPGEELFNTYGDRPNSELLLRYGFVDTPNPFDSVDLDLDFITAHFGLDEDRADARLSACDRFGFLGDNTLALKPSSPFFDDSLRGLVYVLNMSKTEFAALRKLPKPRAEVKKQLATPEVQKLTDSKLCELLKARMALFPTSVEEDEALLATELSTRKRNAVIVRLGEKKILQAVVASLLDEEKSS